MFNEVNYTVVDIDVWNRKEHFEFFSSFSEPFYGICTDLDCTTALINSKKNNYSFFLFYLYAILKGVNNVEEFRLRILDGKPVLFNRINASPTIGRQDNTFSFSFIPCQK